MTWNSFIDHYCERYELDLNPELNGERLSGQRLIEIKLLTYIIRLYFNIAYSTLSKRLGIHKASCQRFYSDVLLTPIYRNEADERYRKCSEHLSVLMKQSG